MLATEPAVGAADATRDYFFQAGVDSWYSKIERFTFPTAFTPIAESEARAIIRCWKDVGSTPEGDARSVEIPSALADLVRRVDELIRDKFADAGGVFVKLSTRSPKDSKTIFRRAEAAYAERLRRGDGSGIIRPGDGSCSRAGSCGVPAEDLNRRLVAFSEEMVKAAVVRSGAEAVTLLLDSWRVAEDLMYAFDEGAAAAPISLVVRGWDARIRPQCEFRAFVHDHQLTCVGQYWHSLYLPELQAVKDTVARDCQALFEEHVKAALPVPTAMLDVAWFGPGQALLIEVNPLMEVSRDCEWALRGAAIAQARCSARGARLTRTLLLSSQGLGSFKGSTGLFDYYEDEAQLSGRLPFELRLRTEPEGRAELLSHMSLDWRRVVLGF